jgi:AcrR family transcriptional regulator
MPHRFTDNQITNIRQKIIAAAMQKVTETGVRKTTVEDLTKAAGISTGAFYKFFLSKEALFFEVYEILEERLRDDFWAVLEQLPAGDRKRLKQDALDLIASENMQRLVTMIRKDELNYLIMSIDPERIRQHSQSDRDYMKTVLDYLNQKGIPMKKDSELLTAYIQALFILIYEKNLLFSKEKQVISSFLDAIIVDMTNPD